MVLSKCARGFLCGCLAAALPVLAAQEPEKPGPVDQFKEEVKDAAHAVGETATKVGQEIKEGAHKVGDGVK